MRIFHYFLALLFVTGLFSCRTPSIDPSDGKDLANTDRSPQIRSEVIASLEAKHKDSKNKLWSASRGSVSPDWLLASPEGYWGRTDEQMPRDFECTPGDSGCDDTFARKVCSRDQDCKGTNTSCRILEASASASRSARMMCLSSADSLIDRVYKTMIRSEQHLEVVSLSMPSGILRTAFINALTILHQKSKPPTVRILLSGEEVAQINQLQPAQKALEKVWNEMRKAGDLGATSRMTMNMGYISWQTSWNHAKIIIADKKHMIQGGHNLWGDPYLITRPVSDLSMEVTGPVVSAAQDFVEALWTENSKLKSTLLLLGAYFGSLPDRNVVITTPPLPGSDQGSIPMIAVGRLGSFGENPSDEANKAMIRAAKFKIDFIVQDIYGLISNLKIVQAKPWVFDELADALMRGLRLRVIQSDTDIGVNDYTLVNYQYAHELLIQNVIDYANQKGFKAPGGQSPRTYFCKLVEYAPIRYVPGKSRWDREKGYGSHAKLMIVDDSAFYMGSHNYYTANLQEFGIIVTDQALTKALQEQYWQPLWNVSQGSVANCNS